MNRRLAAPALVVAAAAAASLLASASSGAPQPPNCGPPLGCEVALTTTGPSPSTLTMNAEGNARFYNQDSVSHTVAFANGLCSLAVAPGSEKGCSDRFMFFAGVYPYTVDGRSGGTVVTKPLPRRVSLTARTHRIRRGTRLTLRGQVVQSYTGSAPPPPVEVFRVGQAKPVATVRTKGAHQTTYSWRLSVRPHGPTTYVAKVVAQRLCYYPASSCAQPRGQVWADATSRRFTVGIRGASANASHEALRRTTIKVSTHNSRYVLSAKSAPRGVVIFKITNPASQPHDFSIKGRTSKLLTKGQSATLRVTFLRKGRYSYKDTFDHHAQFGCRGGFRIT